MLYVSHLWNLLKRDVGLEFAEETERNKTFPCPFLIAHIIRLFLLFSQTSLDFLKSPSGASSEGSRGREAA